MGSNRQYNVIKINNETLSNPLFVLTFSRTPKRKLKFEQPAATIPYHNMYLTLDTIHTYLKVWYLMYGTYYGIVRYHMYDT